MVMFIANFTVVSSNSMFQWPLPQIHTHTACDTHTLCPAKCNGTRAQELFDIEITSNKTVLAVIGCGCSVVTERVLRGSDIPMVSM